MKLALSLADIIIEFHIAYDELTVNAGMSDFVVHGRTPDWTVHFLPFEIAPRNDMLMSGEDFRLRYFTDGKSIVCERKNGTQDFSSRSFVNLSERRINCYLRYYGMTSSAQLAMLLYHLPLALMLMERDALLLHSSQVALPSGSLIFTAPSGVGKSTQARLWADSPFGARPVSGDRSVLRRSEERGWYSCGFYADGSDRICRNEINPVRNVIFLSRTPDDLPRVQTLSASEAFKRFYSELFVVNLTREVTESFARLVESLASSVDFCCLYATPDERSVDALASALGIL